MEEACKSFPKTTQLKNEKGFVGDSPVKITHCY